MIARLRLLIVTLWVGSLWSIGFLAVPTLFATLGGRLLAGAVATILFNAEAWFSIGCALVLLLTILFDRTARRGSRTTMLIVLVMLACTLIIQFGLQPEMETMREAAGAGDVLDSATRTHFMLLHSAASAVYLLQSLMGLCLVFRGRRLS